MQQLSAAEGLFRYQSGRVIALGRMLLVSLFLIAILLDTGEPGRAMVETYVLLFVYATVAVAIAVAAWRNWWIDARLAVPSHAIDMAVFTAIVFSSNGTTSPFFLFFVLPLLSAAIRWNWRETALTASALVILYLIAGLLVAGHQTFELERFVIRSGHLIILSLLLIWFGIHQRRTRLFFYLEDFETSLGQREGSPAQALEVPMLMTKARAGALLVGPAGEEARDGFSIRGGEQSAFSVERPLVRDAEQCVLYDVARNRALTRDSEGQFQFRAASDFLDLDQALSLGLGEGIIAEVRTGTQEGWLVLWDIPEISTDFIDLGQELGRAAGSILDRSALLGAIESGAAARTRLSLARDVHDGIIQFLAGTAFRIEAMKRAARSGNDIGGELDELKRLLIEEQGEIRGFVTALRQDREVDLADSIAELRVLAERLSNQWSVVCRISASDEQASIPIRLHLDLQQLLREAVANAVRHGGADHIEVGLALDDSRLELKVADNGRGFAQRDAATQPWSLKERVERAHGSIRLVSSPGSTNVLISLPLAGAAA